MYLFFKRTLDVLASISAIILLLPLFFFLCILLKLSAEGEIFYFQERIGLNNKKFFIWKFATMLKNSMAMGTGSITLRNDFRVTKVGKYLRITKINELPQLFNILKGDISIVGPRPLVQRDFDAYSSKFQKKIYRVKPGLTGIGSIVFRDEESILSKNKNPHDFYKKVIAPYKGELEMWYQSNNSFILDLKLIFLTVLVVFLPKINLYEKWFPNLPKRNF